MAHDGDSGIQLLRHTVATLAYRGAKVIRDVPDEVATFRAGPTTRTPQEILCHLCDLVDWAFHLAKDGRRYMQSQPADWVVLSERFFENLKLLDGALASGAQLVTPAGQIFQGPIADALTHVGQIAMLRRMAGAAVKGENYHRAAVAVGRVGAEQEPPRRDFD